ncbi:MAG: cytochrome c maturation protein CcmE [Anaerolineae bacterium]
MGEEAIDWATYSSRPARRNRIKFLLGGAVIALAVVYLIFTATQSTAAYFFTISELYTRREAVYDRYVRVSGRVTHEAIQFDPRELILRFQIADENGQVLSVVFHGPKPDQLRPDAEAILEGKFDGKVFTAQTILLKCPSKYEEEKGIAEEKVEAVR